VRVHQRHVGLAELAALRREVGSAEGHREALLRAGRPGAYDRVTRRAAINRCVTQVELPSRVSVRCCSIGQSCSTCSGQYSDMQISCVNVCGQNRPFDVADGTA
jgi:hypothetical protein